MSTCPYLSACPNAKWIGLLLSIGFGYIISLYVGHKVTRWYVDRLWKLTPLKDRPESLQGLQALRTHLGVAERALCTTLVAMGKPQGIAVWLVFKAAMRFADKDKTDVHLVSSTVYMIGTIVSLAFGAVGGFLIAVTYSELF
jgi:hypothetical protein